MNITPDQITFFTLGPIEVNATIVFTWIIMCILVFISWLATRTIGKKEHPDGWQFALELMVLYTLDQIGELTGSKDRTILTFIGTLFLFIAVSNIISVVPGFESPTGSLNTTASLAICVFFAVPVFGISKTGVGSYLKHYLEPSIFMLPFNIIGEFSRTLALAVRLFGNMMSGKLIAGVLLSLVPILIPVAMHLFGILIGLIQAYIFAVLAIVYIASGLQSRSGNHSNQSGSDNEDN